MCKENKCLVPIIISIILGVLGGILFFTGVISEAIILTPIIYGIIFAAISTILLFKISAFAIKREVRKCICDYGLCLSTGGIGTLIIGFFALTYISSIVEGSLAAAILIAVGIFFLVLTLLSFIALSFCMVKGNCCRESECYDCNNNYKCS